MLAYIWKVCEFHLPLLENQKGITFSPTIADSAKSLILYPMLEFDFPPLQPMVFTVTSLTNYLREVLETDEILRDVWVRGEISNFTQPRSGHLYSPSRTTRLSCLWIISTFSKEISEELLIIKSK